MTDPLDRLAAGLEHVHASATDDQANRLDLLLAHALWSVVIGWLIYTDGGPTVWTHPTLALALPIGLGGTLLGFGLIAGRRLHLEAAGLAVLLGWDLVMAWLFYSSPETTTSYPVAVYLYLAHLVLVHLLTIARRLRRVRRFR